MNNYELKVDKSIKEMVYLKINNISMIENIDYIVLDDKKTIRLISDKAKEGANIFSEEKHEI